MKPIVFLLLLPMFAFCSFGQGTKKGMRPSVPATGKSGIIRTQGTGQYANVHCNMQDTEGNLWFGTTGEGVYRYDGKTFTQFTEQDGLCSNHVWCMLQDKSGAIWLGTMAGLCRYDPAAALKPGGLAFTTVPVSLSNSAGALFLNGTPPGGSQIGVSSLLQDRTGKIWAGTARNGVYCYDGNRFTHFLHGDGVVNKNGVRLFAVNSMIEDRKGNIWFTTWTDGICRYDGRSIVNYKPNGEVWYACLLEDRAGNIWAGRRDKGVCRYNPAVADTFANVLQHGILDSCCVNCMAEDKAGNIWLGTEYGELAGRETMGGVWRYNPHPLQGGSSRPFKNFTMKDGLSNMAVFCMITDRQGNVWFGSRGMGLSRYDPSTALIAGAKPIQDFSDKAPFHKR